MQNFYAGFRIEMNIDLIQWKYKQYKQNNNLNPT